MWSTFSHPDFTVGDGIAPSQSRTGFADFTAGQEFPKSTTQSHLAPKISLKLLINNQLSSQGLNLETALIYSFNALTARVSESTL